MCGFVPSQSRSSSRFRQGSGSSGSRSFVGLGGSTDGLRLASCSCSYCSRTASFTVSRLCSGVWCCFASAARYRTLNSCKASCSFCGSSAISGNKRLGFVQASPDFHSHVIVIQIPFLGNLAVIEANDIMPPKQIGTFRLGGGQQFYCVVQIVPDGGGHGRVLRR